MFRRPAEFFPNFTRVCIKRRHVSRPTTLFHDRDSVARHPAGDFDHFADAGAVTGARIIEAGITRLQHLERSQVSVRQILNVDVVSNTGAVGRVVVGSKNLDLFAPAERDHQHIRNQVRFRIVVFADSRVGARPGGIEIAQGDEPKIPSRSRIGQSPFDRELGPSIRTLRHSAHIFDKRHATGNAIDGTGGAKDELADIVALHSRQQPDRIAHIVVIELERFQHRLPYLDKRGEVDDGLKLFTRKNIVQQCSVRKIAFAQACIRTHRGCVSRRKVVQHDDLVTSTQQGTDGMAADVAGASGDQNFHSTDSHGSSNYVHYQGLRFTTPIEYERTDHIHYRTWTEKVAFISIDKTVLLIL